MKTVSNYQIAKQALKNASIEYKRFIKNDKPLIRMTINDDSKDVIQMLKDIQEDLKVIALVSE